MMFNNSTISYSNTTPNTLDWIAIDAAMLEPTRNVPRSPEGVPFKGAYVFPTSFKCELNIQTIISVITEILALFVEVETDNHGNIDYNYDEKNFKWRVFHAYASTYSDFEIRIYYDDLNLPYIIEFHCYSKNSNSIGDKCIEIFRAAKSKLTGIPDEPTLIFNNPFEDDETYEQVQSTLEIISKMVEEKEGHYIGSQILCDLVFQKDDGLKEKLCKNGCIHLLSKLLENPEEETLRCTIFALSELSDNPYCAVQIGADINIVSYLHNFTLEETIRTAAIHRGVKKCLSNIK